MERHRPEGLSQCKKCPAGASPASVFQSTDWRRENAAGLSLNRPHQQAVLEPATRLGAMDRTDDTNLSPNPKNTARPQSSISPSTRCLKRRTHAYLRKVRQVHYRRCDRKSLRPITNAAICIPPEQRDTKSIPR